jgi:hypothetical protein
MAHNSSADFSGYDAAPAYMDNLLAEAGLTVTRRDLVDSAESPRILELPRGWHHHHAPDGLTEFDSWEFGRQLDRTDVATVFVTSALVRDGLAGGGPALAEALASGAPSGVYRRALWPLFAESHWFSGFISTQCFTLPAGWPHTWPLIRYTWSDLDPSSDPRNPFGAHCTIPVGMREYIWWWVTSPRSAYTRPKTPTAENLPFIYRKILAISNELVLGLREVLHWGEPPQLGSEQAQDRLFRGTLRPVSAPAILATEAQTRRAILLGDGAVLARLRLAKLMARQPLDAALNRLLGRG